MDTIRMRALAPDEVALLERATLGNMNWCGERFTLADVVLALSINRWRMTPIVDRPTLAAVDRYYAALAERSGFRQHCDNGSP